MKTFSSIDQYSKKKRGKSFLQKEAEFMIDIDELFDIFFSDDQQRDSLKNNTYFEWQTKISNSILTKKDQGWWSVSL